MHTHPGQQTKEKVPLNEYGTVKAGQYLEVNKEGGKGHDYVLISISSLTIANRLYELLRIHGHAMYEVRIHTFNVERVMNLFIWLVVKYIIGIHTAS